MNVINTAVAILTGLHTARASKITASIALDVVDDDSPEGYSLIPTVMVDGFGAHHDDFAAAAEDLARRVDEAIADRAKLG
jgi:hypothetical protein